MQQYDNTGIEHDSFKAPWRQKDQEPREFGCLCSQTLSKVVPVFSNGYTLIPEDGIVDVETSTIDWKEEYHENDHYTPIQLLELFQKLLRNQLGEDNFNKSRAYLQHLIEECELWCEDETEFMEG